jgi:hypothetical protein
MFCVPLLAQGTPPAPPAPPAGDGHSFAKVREACRPDVERLCKDVKPGDGRIRECLKAHAPELSDGCKAAIKEAREHHHPPG